ncbi:Hydrocephalus-inducing-like protein, partial [Aduncisulcus paluster]
MRTQSVKFKDKKRSKKTLQKKSTSFSAAELGSIPDEIVIDPCLPGKTSKRIITIQNNTDTTKTYVITTGPACALPQTGSVESLKAYHDREVDSENILTESYFSIYPKRFSLPPHTPTNIEFVFSPPLQSSRQTLSAATSHLSFCSANMYGSCELQSAPSDKLLVPPYRLSLTLYLCSSPSFYTPMKVVSMCGSVEGAVTGIWGCSDVSMPLAEDKWEVPGDAIDSSTASHIGAAQSSESICSVHGDEPLFKVSLSPLDIDAPKSLVPWERAVASGTVGSRLDACGIEIKRDETQRMLEKKKKRMDDETDLGDIHCSRSRHQHGDDQDIIHRASSDLFNEGLDDEEANAPIMGETVASTEIPSPEDEAFPEGAPGQSPEDIIGSSHTVDEGRGTDIGTDEGDMEEMTVQKREEEEQEPHPVPMIPPHGLIGLDTRYSRTEKWNGDRPFVWNKEIDDMTYDEERMVGQMSGYMSTSSRDLTLLSLPSRPLPHLPTCAILATPIGTFTDVEISCRSESVCNVGVVVDISFLSYNNHMSSATIQTAPSVFPLVDGAVCVERESSLRVPVFRYAPVELEHVCVRVDVDFVCLDDSEQAQTGCVIEEGDTIPLQEEYTSVERRRAFSFIVMLKPISPSISLAPPLIRGSDVFISSVFRTTFSVINENQFPIRAVWNIDSSVFNRDDIILTNIRMERGEERAIIGPHSSRSFTLTFQPKVLGWHDITIPIYIRSLPTCISSVPILRDSDGSRIGGFIEADVNRGLLEELYDENDEEIVKDEKENKDLVRERKMLKWAMDDSKDDSTLSSVVSARVIFRSVSSFVDVIENECHIGPVSVGSCGDGMITIINPTPIMCSYYIRTEEEEIGFWKEKGRVIVDENGGRMMDFLERKSEVENPDGYPRQQEGLVRESSQILSRQQSGSISMSSGESDVAALFFKDRMVEISDRSGVLRPHESRVINISCSAEHMHLPEACLLAPLKTWIRIYSRHAVGVLNIESELGTIGSTNIGNPLVSLVDPHISSQLHSKTISITGILFENIIRVDTPIILCGFNPIDAFKAEYNIDRLPQPPISKRPLINCPHKETFKLINGSCIPSSFKFKNQKCSKYTISFAPLYGVIPANSHRVVECTLIGHSVGDLNIMNECVCGKDIVGVCIKAEYNIDRLPQPPISKRPLINCPHKETFKLINGSCIPSSFKFKNQKCSKYTISFAPLYGVIPANSHRVVECTLIGHSVGDLNIMNECLAWLLPHSAFKAEYNIDRLPQPPISKRPLINCPHKETFKLINGSCIPSSFKFKNQKCSKYTISFAPLYGVIPANSHRVVECTLIGHSVGDLNIMNECVCGKDIVGVCIKARLAAPSFLVATPTPLYCVDSTPLMHSKLKTFKLINGSCIPSSFKFKNQKCSKYTISFAPLYGVIPANSHRVVECTLIGHSVGDLNIMNECVCGKDIVGVCIKARLAAPSFLVATPKPIIQREVWEQCEEEGDDINSDRIKQPTPPATVVSSEVQYSTQDLDEAIEPVQGDNEEKKEGEEEGKDREEQKKEEAKEEKEGGGEEEEEEEEEDGAMMLESPCDNIQADTVQISTIAPSSSLNRLTPIFSSHPVGSCSVVRFVLQNPTHSELNFSVSVQNFLPYSDMQEQKRLETELIEQAQREEEERERDEAERRSIMHGSTVKRPSSSSRRGSLARLSKSVTHQSLSLSTTDSQRSLLDSSSQKLRTKTVVVAPAVSDPGYGLFRNYFIMDKIERELKLMQMMDKSGGGIPATVRSFDQSPLFAAIDLPPFLFPSLTQKPTESIPCPIYLRNKRGMCSILGFEPRECEKLEEDISEESMKEKMNISIGSMSGHWEQWKSPSIFEPTVSSDSTVSNSNNSDEFHEQEEGEETCLPIIRRPLPFSSISLVDPISHFTFSLPSQSCQPVSVMFMSCCPGEYSEEILISCDECDSSCVIPVVVRSVGEGILVGKKTRRRVDEERARKEEEDRHRESFANVMTTLIPSPLGSSVTVTGDKAVNYRSKMSLSDLNATRPLSSLSKAELASMLIQTISSPLQPPFSALSLSLLFHSVLLFPVLSPHCPGVQRTLQIGNPTPFPIIVQCRIRTKQRIGSPALISSDNQATRLKFSSLDEIKKLWELEEKSCHEEPCEEEKELSHLCNEHRKEEQQRLAEEAEKEQKKGKKKPPAKPKKKTKKELEEEKQREEEEAQWAEKYKQLQELTRAREERIATKRVAVKQKWQRIETDFKKEQLR